MTRPPNSDRPGEPTLLAVFPFGLWPYQSPLDWASWRLATGIAAALSEVPSLLAYASQAGLVNPAALRDPSVPLQVFRSLPPADTVRRECGAVGARWALTGRVLTDREGIECWLNVLDGATGDLCWTRRIQPEVERTLFALVGLLRRMTRDLGVPGGEVIEVADIAGTGSWAAFVTYCRTIPKAREWRAGAQAAGVDALHLASRALAQDPDYSEPVRLLEEMGPSLVESASGPAELGHLMDRLVGEGQLDPVRTLRGAIHDRRLALAQRGGQTYISDDTEQ